MAELSIQWQGDGVARMTAAIDKLKGPAKLTVLRRALNHTGDKTYTMARRAIAKRAGISQRVIDEYGAMKKQRANGATLEYRVKATGKGIPLRRFAANQTRKGVSVSVWNKRYLLPHAFMVASMGGNVFWRRGKERLPLKKPTGPSIPKELVKKYVDVEFQRLVQTELPPRVEHELRVLTDGILS